MLLLLVSALVLGLKSHFGADRKRADCRRLLPMFLLDSAGTKGPGVGGTVKSFSAKAECFGEGGCCSFVLLYGTSKI